MASFLTRLIGATAPARVAQVKSSRAATVFPIGLPGLTRPQPRRLSELVRQGYEQNPIVFRSVRMVAESVASVPWLAYVDGVEAPDHPALGLMKAPNAAQTGATFIETLVSNLILFGNAYVEGVSIGGELKEL